VTIAVHNRIAISVALVAIEVLDYDLARLQIRLCGRSLLSNLKDVIVPSCIYSPDRILFILIDIGIDAKSSW
jgi:hypothetical protein